VHGSGFTITESLACKIGSLQVHATVVSGFVITCVTPSHTQGNQPFQIALHGRGMPGVIDGFKFVR